MTDYAESKDYPPERVIAQDADPKKPLRVDDPRLASRRDCGQIKREYRLEASSRKKRPPGAWVTLRRERRHELRSRNYPLETLTDAALSHTNHMDL